eukprot:CAMPEP_0206614712 /NCGR_PEP_ID=MMETSP0325_2-20121206/57597_1 /ASSEMBLY_ACC=CAM_ASM_000347 /TAXON_ID=2866 /ORGANISM="Crypthecodinium cohnii, Strain Seligo" /LENGTH=485 /DNA_ID=CAMNT_0054135345 /DNA_START=365 /DNA_END=1822 /DNA_ORIENTATION=+
MLGSILAGDRPICCTQPQGCVEMLLTDPGTGNEDPNASFLLPLQSSVLPPGPRQRELRSYRVNTQGKDVYLGEPLVCGDVLYVNVGHSIEEMQLVICPKGFMLIQRTDRCRYQGDMSSELHMLWSPFTVVERCQVNALKQSEKWAVFKITVFRQEGMDLNLYFASSGPDADKQRSAWIAVISQALATVTQSLIPEHELRVQPVQGRQRTSTRIMAGYLLYSDALEKVTLCYCELHAPLKGMAELVFYPDEHCEEEMKTLTFSANASASTRKGSYCTIFGLDSHRFCARSRTEKDLWLRAVSNILVKLMFDRRDPTPRDLALYRAAVFERVESMSNPSNESGRCLDGNSSTVKQLLPAISATSATAALVPIMDEALEKQIASSRNWLMRNSSTVKQLLPAISATSATAALVPIMDEEPRRPLPAVVGDVLEPPEPGDEKAVVAIAERSEDPHKVVSAVRGDAHESPESGDEEATAFVCEEDELRFI